MPLEDTDSLRKNGLLTLRGHARTSCMIDDALQLACRNAGGRKALAAAIGVTRQAIEQWRRVPAERVLDVERVSRVSRHDLRPDIFGVTPPVYVPVQVFDRRAGI